MRALIIGTGLGGLATALRLVQRGYQVTMVEQYHQPGGRLNQIKKDGFTFDMAPSFFSMSYEFKELMEDCQMDMPFNFHELNPLYAVNFAGRDKTYQIYKDIGRLAGEFESIEPHFTKKINQYLKATQRLFHDTEGKVIRKNFTSVVDFLITLTTVPLRHLPLVFRSFMQELDRHFTSDEVKQILSLTAFFLGATPYNTPAIYTLLSYTELSHDGYYNVQGGMYTIVEGMVRELEKRGVTIHFNTTIVDVDAHKNSVRAMIDKNGKRWEYDIYISNSDAAVFRGTVLKRKRYTPEKLDKMHWTLAPFTLYLGIDSKIPALHHHHYFLGNNFKEYASGIFRNKISMKHPYYYVNTLSRFNPESAPEGCESLFILCPVPDLRYKPDWSDASALADNIIQDLSERVGFNIRAHLLSKTILTPVEWEKMFGLHRGSGLSLGHQLQQIGAFRPSNKDEQLRNLFYVGSSTVPGTGLPMAIISSKLVTERISSQYGSISS